MAVGVKALSGKEVIHTLYILTQFDIIQYGFLERIKVNAFRYPGSTHQNNRVKNVNDAIISFDVLGNNGGIFHLKPL